MFTQQQVQNAHNVLGLEQGCTLEVIKAAYKQAALRTHPDKNPGNPEATVEFQRIGEAYRILDKHLSQPAHTNPFGDYSDDGYDEYNEADEDLLNQAYFMYIFEMMMNSERVFVRRSESPREYKDRLERQLREQVEAEKRREREAKLFKERRAREQEEARITAEKRQKEKQEAKKAQVEIDRRKAEEASRLRSQKVQHLRSDIFAAARAGNVAKVKQGVWEQSVDASGGEIKDGCDPLVKVQPKDPKETMLHIAVKNGDLELVQWLESHGADMEERNSQGLTVLHIALKLGQLSIVEHIFEDFPPADVPSMYEVHAPESLLLLALQSGKPELVWMILDQGLATSDEINMAWAQATSDVDHQSSKTSSPQRAENHSDVIQLLMRFGGFTPPPTPQSVKGETAPPTRPKSKPGKKGHQAAQARHSPVVPETSAASAKQMTDNNTHTNPGRGRGRNRGRGRGRGRGLANPATHR